MAWYRTITKIIISKMVHFVTRDVTEPFDNDNIPITYLFMLDNDTNHASKLFKR